MKEEEEEEVEVDVVVQRMEMGAPWNKGWYAMSTNQHNHKNSTKTKY